MSPIQTTAIKLSPMRRLFAIMAALSFMLTGSVVAAQQASAVPALSSGWTQPLDSMSGLSAGFMANNCGHAGYGGYISGKYHIANDYGRAAGTAVYAIGAGTVVAKQSNWPGSALFVRHTAPDGTQFLSVYGHINSGLVVNNTVSAGQQIGTVYNDGTNSHLHFGIREATAPATSNNGNMPCSSWPNDNGYRDPLPFLAAHPIGGGTPPPATSAMVIINDQGWLWGKNALSQDGWTNQHAGAEKIAVGGSRIALINDQGELWAKDGTSTTGWTDQSALATDVAVSSSGRIVIINDQGWLWAKDTLSPGGWTNQHAGAEKIAIGGDRFALINDQGRLWAKDGINTSSWIDQDVTVTDVAVSSSGRIVITVPGGGVWAKDTLDSGGWIDQGVTAEKIAIGNNRIALINDQGELWAKDTIGLYGWIDQDVIATDVSVGSTGRIVIINDQGWLWAKDTLALTVWENQHAGAEKVAVG